MPLAVWKLWQFSYSSKSATARANRCENWISNFLNIAFIWLLNFYIKKSKIHQVWLTQNRWLLLISAIHPRQKSRPGQLAEQIRLEEMKVPVPEYTQSDTELERQELETDPPGYHSKDRPGRSLPKNWITVLEWTSRNRSKVLLYTKFDLHGTRF